MAWETVDDGMGCIHCFTYKGIGKSETVSGEETGNFPHVSMLLPEQRDVSECCRNKKLHLSLIDMSAV